jgi:transposase InsO family protein
MRISPSRAGNPYDNAHMESFFKTLKYEEVHLSNYEPSMMSPNDVPISSRKCTTRNGYIRLWGI